MKRTRLLLAFLLGLAAGVGGGALLVMERQCGKIESLLREDFRVLLFLKAEPDQTGQEVLEEKLMALPDVEEARYVSRQEALSRLRREDPELVESVTLLGENPLDPAYEVKLGAGAFGSFPQWAAQAHSVADWADLRFKPAQIQAILQAQFYGRFMNLASSAAVCLAALMALAGLWGFARRTRSAPAWSLRPPTSLLVSAAGGACGAGLSLLMALPMRFFPPGWAWPSGARVVLLVLAAAVAGWALCGRGD